MFFVDYCANFKAFKGSQTPPFSFERGLVHFFYFSLLEG
jgi:hypothetical protein